MIAPLGTGIFVRFATILSTVNPVHVWFFSATLNCSAAGIDLEAVWVLARVGIQ